MNTVSQKLYVFLMLFYSTLQNLPAQSVAADTAKPVSEINNSYAEAGIQYISNIVFPGRKDSVAVPYVSPSIGYSHKSGVFVKGSLSWLTSAKEMDSRLQKPRDRRIHHVYDVGGNR